jgi:subtilase family serine protease
MIMKTLAQNPSLATRILLSTIALAATLLPAAGFAQSPALRIAGEVSSAQRSAVANSATPRAQAQYSTGRLAGNTSLQGMSIVFSRTPAQEAALKTLIAAQQNPSSPQYHKWLTPSQFAARFGLADADIAKVRSWLEQQGFSIDSVSNGKNLIRFSGTSAQAEAAFGTEIHSYSIPTVRGTESHFAPATALTVPSALAGVVLSVRGLDNFKPHTHLSSHRNQIKPKYTWNGGSGLEVFFDPGDIATIYDIKQEQAAYSGAGQTITIVGESQIATSDLQAFWTAAGITRDNPTITLVPGTGTSHVLADGDEAESDLDLEWSGAIAQGAALNFVYVGNSNSASAFDSLEYAIDEQIGTIISSSYGDCETDIGQSKLMALDSIVEQGAAQGQTILSASGDSGATDCLADTNLTLTQQRALAVDYPASSAYVTAVGGTEISQANASYQTPGDGYWEPYSSSAVGVNSTALKYIPEQAWNESSLCDQYAIQNGDTTTSDYVCGGGGGASSFFSKPSWQTALTPADSKRDVPDVALNAAIYNPGYLFCTSDQSFWSSGQANSCNSGFLDSSTEDPTVVGGTSVATPIFAGMLALINQQKNYTTGQGVANTTLYSLAANSATYASAFHDITAGNNACDISAACGSSNSTSFTAGTGYDQATGLGSVDLFNLAAAWPANTGSTAGLITTTTTVAATTASPAVNASDTFTITVAPTTGTGTPSGSIAITVDTNSAITETLSSNGTYTYTTSFSTTGPHTIAVRYAGDSTYAASSGTITVTVPTTSSGSGTFTLAATNVTIAQGSQGSSTVTVTPAGGYTGTVQLSISTTNNDLANDSCYTADDISVSGTAAATGSITLDTNGQDCATTGSARKHGVQKIHAAGITGNSVPGPVTALGILAGLLLAGFIGRRSAKLRVFAGIILLAAFGLAFTGCGSSSASTTSPNVPKGTYTITVTGVDSTSSSITNTTSFTLTVD